MSAAQQRKLSATTYGQEPTTLLAQITPFDRGERIRRALKVAAPLLLGALLTAPILGVHLFSVPAFLILAGYFGSRRFRQEAEVTELSGPCPACGRHTDFPPPSDWSFPQTVRCRDCSEFVTLALD